MEEDALHLMLWITALVILIGGLVIWVRLTETNEYTVKVDYCNSDSIDVEVAKTVCVTSCTEKFPYSSDYERLKICYGACRG